MTQATPRSGPKFRIVQAAPAKIIFPVLLTVVLFIVTISLIILPRFETQLMERKREMIHALTEMAWSTVRHYAAKEQAGELSRPEAQSMAVEHLRHLRYGPELKDYFWINDMHPRMIMHPYRPDLEGQDLTRLTDPAGKRLFVEFVDIVRQQGSASASMRRSPSTSRTIR